MNDAICKKECIQIQKFDWKQFECSEIDDHIEIVFAADGITRKIGLSFSVNTLSLFNLVIYDDDITDALFNVFAKLFQEKSKLYSIYITIEKRINFYLETRSVQCPAYEYFLEKLDQFKTQFPLLVAEEMNTDLKSIKQCTKIYERTNELVNIFQKKFYLKHNFISFYSRFFGISIILNDIYHRLYVFFHKNTHHNLHFKNVTLMNFLIDLVLLI